jgi:hypothetical protein
MSARFCACHTFENCVIYIFILGMFKFLILSVLFSGCKETPETSNAIVTETPGVPHMQELETQLREALNEAGLV